MILRSASTKLIDIFSFFHLFTNIVLLRRVPAHKRSLPNPESSATFPFSHVFSWIIYTASTALNFFISSKLDVVVLYKKLSVDAHFMWLILATSAFFGCVPRQCDSANNNFHGQSSSTSAMMSSAATNNNDRTLFSSFSSPVRRDHWRVFLYHRIAPIDPVQHACYGSPLQSGVNGTFAAAPPPFGRPLMCRWQVNVRPGTNIEFRFDQQNQQRFVPQNFIPKTLSSSSASFDPSALTANQHMMNHDMQLRSGLLSRRLRILNMDSNSHETNSPYNNGVDNMQQCQREWIAIYDGNELADHSRLRSAGGGNNENYHASAVCTPGSTKPKARICAGADVPETLVLESNSAVVEVCSSASPHHHHQQHHQNHQFSHFQRGMPPLRFGSTLLDPPKEPQHLISSVPPTSSAPSTSLIRVSWAVNEELYLERVCNKVYTNNNAKAGVIMSPGFGVRNYPDNIAACDYEFIADPGMVLEFNTEVFQVEEPTSNGLCMFDSLTVLEKFATSQFEPVASFCGAVGPQLLTTHPHVKLRFRTDSTYNERGFIVKWNMIVAPHKTLECGRSAVPPILAQAQQIKQLLPGQPVLAPIVGGSEARPYSWPWQVGILTKGTNKVFCGAALIAPQWLISAAHCFYPGLPYDSNFHAVFLDSGQLRQYEVRIGEHDLLRYEGPELRLSIDRVMMNPKFDPDTVDSDISLIRLDQPIPIRSDDDSKRLICLPPRKRKLKPGTVCYIVGWGETTPMDGNVREAQQQVALSIPTTPLVINVLNGNDSAQQTAAKLVDIHEESFANLLTAQQQQQQNSSPVVVRSDRHRLRQAPVPILPQKICKGFFPDAITNNMFCAGYRDGAVDACQGDSGGPLVCLNENGAFEITGVTSWGFGCAQPKLPGVYVHVAHYVEWIQEVLANN